MNFDDASAFRSALDEVVDDRAAGDRVRAIEFRRMVAFERVLARLLAIAPNRWALSGDLALDLRLERPVRCPWRLELEWWVESMAGFNDAFFELGKRDVGDFFEFDVELSGQSMMGMSASGSFTAHARLAGSSFESVLLNGDLRFGALPTETIRTEGLLDFAGVEPIEVPVVPIELQLAESAFHYLSMFDSEMDVEDSGAACLLDIAMIARRGGLDPSLLSGALAAIFKQHYAEAPARLRRPPARWAAAFDRLAAEAGAPPGLSAGHMAAAAALDPALADLAGDGVRSGDRREWIVRAPDEHPPL